MSLAWVRRGPGGIADHRGSTYTAVGESGRGYVVERVGTNTCRLLVNGVASGFRGSARACRAEAERREGEKS